MPKANIVQTNFTSGEISELLGGRIDVSKFHNGVKLMDNFIPLPQGGITRRPGTQYVGTVKDSAANFQRLQKFIFSTSQAYLLEWGNQYVRVYKDGNPLGETRTITAITQANPAVVTYIGSDNLTNGDRVLIQNVSGMTEIEGLEATVANLNTGLKTFELSGVNSSAFTAFAGGEYLKFTDIATPYLTVDLPKLRFAQSADTLFIAHPDYKPRTLVRGANEFTWTLAEETFLDGPYLAVNTNEDHYLQMNFRDAVEEISNITQANPAVVTTTNDHPFVTGDVIFIRDVVGMTEVNDRRFTITKLTATTFELDGEDSTGHTAYSSAGEAVKFAEDQVAITSITQANPAVVTAAAHGFTNGDRIIITDVSGMTQVNKKSFLVANVTTNTFELSGIDSSAFSAYSSGGIARRPIDIAEATFNSATLPGTGTEVGTFVEYRNDNKWGLAEIIAFDTTTHCWVKVIDAVKNPDVNDGFRHSSSTMTSHFSDTFGEEDIGKYIVGHGSTKLRVWMLASLLNASSGSSVSGFDLTGSVTIYPPRAQYPGVLAVVTNRVIRVSVTSNENTFDSTDDDSQRWIRFRFSTTWVRGKIIEYLSAQSVRVELLEYPPLDVNATNGTAPNTNRQYNKEVYNNGKTSFWRLGAWSDRADFLSLGKNWPQFVIFHEGRIIYAATRDQLQTVWMSVVDDFTNFAPTELDSVVTDSNAVDLTLASGVIDAIAWIISGPVLLVGTAGNEYQIRAASTVNEPISPTNVQATPQTPHGHTVVPTTPLEPVRIGSSTIFVDRSLRRVRDLFYSFELDSHTTSDLNIIAEHIFVQTLGAIDMAYHQNPDSIIWFATQAGKLVGCTYIKDQEILAWHRHTIGGSGIVSAVEVLPSASGAVDDLYLLVKRGSTKTIEKLTNIFKALSPTDLDGPDGFGSVYVDGGIRIFGANQTSVKGLRHLAGLTVTGHGDGVDLGNMTVTANGEIDPLPTIGSTSQWDDIAIGLEYTSQITMFPAEGGSALGLSIARTKRVEEVNFRVYNSSGFDYSVDGSTWVTIDPDEANQYDVDEHVPWLTTDIRADIDGNYSTFEYFHFRANHPFPVTVLAVTRSTKTNE